MYTTSTETNRVKPSGGLSLRRLPGLVVQLPPGVVPLLLSGRREGLPAVVAHKPGRSRETKPFPLPLFHLKKTKIIFEACFCFFADEAKQKQTATLPNTSFCIKGHSLPHCTARGLSRSFLEIRKPFVRAARRWRCVIAPLGPVLLS